MPITANSFRGELAPPYLVERIINQALAGAPFTQSLTPVPTSTGKVVFPLASPTGAEWLNEMQPYPMATLNDDAYTVAAAKLGTIVLLSEESVSDTAFPIVEQLSNMLQDTAMSKLDTDLLNGDGQGTTPRGVLGAATTVPGASWIAGIGTAVGQLGAQGATATRIAFNPADHATENARVSPDGRPIWGPDGVAGQFGLTPVMVPSIPTGQALVYDHTRVYYIQRESEMRFLRERYAEQGAIGIRVTMRAAIAAPAALKSMRLVTLTTTPTATVKTR
ncbi:MULTISPECIES: phage major capsid protein [Actinosynnema]|uniref:phage major capsid protein n=1 Tax=Actinosynnema TaxID=40566 RepID=UPI0020A59BCE|nr:phage major capsid protein [Actinosynnema pretiosum]MCP2099823.1 phage major capsid protein, HK97 family [Actinosynnema pretiosum]MCP2099971.1 phage major capsid protein, HK97 family [Actinosynnema pretiosum]